MGEFWESIQPAVVALALALIPALGMAVRAWLQARTRRWENEAADAWERADQLSSSAPGTRQGDAEREQRAVESIQERLRVPELRARELAQRTRPIPIQLERRAMPPPPPPESERELEDLRDTQPGVGVKLPRG